jgi:TadE-like protein
MRKKALRIGISMAVIFTIAVLAGFKIGGREFVAQHLRPLVVAALCVAALGTLALWTMAGVARGAILAARRPRALGQSGAAAAEFVIVVIPFMLMLTALMQLALASLARVLVSYAAFAAARAAIVVVPMEPKDVDGWKAKVGSAFTQEQENKVGYGSNTRTDFAISTKSAMIRNAASYALIPSSPSVDTVIGDTANNWAAYLEQRAKAGLNPMDYLKSVLGDLSAFPSAILDSATDQLKDAIKDGLTSKDAKDAAKNKVDAWVDGQSGLSQSQKDALKNSLNNYIDNYSGTEESAAGQLGNVVKDQINGALSGPLDKFKDQVQGWVDGAIGSTGGSVGGNFKGYGVDRALDVGFGSGTDGASGAILRSLRKLVYARMGTVVTLLDEHGNFKTNFEWNEPIRVRVTYLFYCQIPLANRIAGKAFYDLPGSTVMDLATGPAKGITVIGIPGYFMSLTAEHTMVNQGKPL